MRLTRDAEGKVTLYGYDDADRLIKTVVNASDPDYNNDYSGTGTDPDLSAYPQSSNVDEDLISETEYDAVGNVVKTTDTAGRVTFTVYDSLNRPVKVVRAANENATIALNPGDTGYDATLDPRSSSYVASDAVDRDLISTTGYDELGRVVQTGQLEAIESSTEVYRTNYTVYDALGRPIRQIANYVEQGSSDPADWVFESAVWKQAAAGTAIDHDSDAANGLTNDQNLITETVYDDEGRVSETMDINRRVSKTVYDGLSRPVKTIANYVEQGSSDPADWVFESGVWKQAASGTAIDHGSNNDQNIISETVYDGDSRVLYTRDVQGQEQYNVYDSAGRVRLRIGNYAVQGASDPMNWLWDSTQSRWEDGSNNPITFGSNADENRITETCMIFKVGRLGRAMSAAMSA